MGLDGISTTGHSHAGAEFDDLVIGSSPLMLLQARVLARAGRRVCLVDRDPALGGSWKTAVLDTGEEVEIACHLIEVFPGVYDELAAAAGVPFVPLDAQPIRIHRTGLTFAYFSRVLMLASGVRLVLGWARARIACAFGRAEDLNRLINFQTKLSGYLRHQVPAFFQRPVMKGPEFGFVDFIDRLLERAQADGVRFRTCDVVALHRADGVWQATGANGQLVSARNVHCTTSTNLRPVGPGRFKAAAQDFAHRFCVVVDVPLASVQVSHTYVAFWNDPAVARISRIDSADQKPAQRFLVEFHDPDRRMLDEAEGIMRPYLEKSRIILPEGSFNIVGHVDCVFTTNVNQLPVGAIDQDFWGYYSMGNLAAGLAAWRKSTKHACWAKLSSDMEAAPNER